MQQLILGIQIASVAPVLTVPLVFMSPMEAEAKISYHHPTTELHPSLPPFFFYILIPGISPDLIYSHSNFLWNIISPSEGLELLNQAFLLCSNKNNNHHHTLNWW